MVKENEMEIMTVTELQKRKEDYFNNPSPELKRFGEQFGNVQKAFLAPLIRRARQLIKK